VLLLDYRSSLGCRNLVHHKRPYKIHISSGCLTLCQFSPRLKCGDYHAAPCGPSRSTILQSRFVSKGQCLWFHSLRYLSVLYVYLPQEAWSRYDAGTLCTHSVAYSNVSPLSPFNPFLVLVFFPFSLLRLGPLLFRQLVDDSCGTWESTAGM